ncbi:MAG: hypothetical protein JXC32_07045 [Anaerolineae bacterium]|nr:hypothetical protein [Anaerolineae bacterium]
MIQQPGDTPSEKSTSLITWLSNANTPSIRYLTLRHLLGRSETDVDARTAWQEMQTTGPIPAIMAGQTQAGHWDGERSYYTPKYISTHWSLLLLAELAADPTDPRLHRGVEFMLTATQNELERAVASEGHGLSCFWGNLLRYALHCGYADDPRVSTIVRYLAHDAREGGWRCAHNDELPCAWGAARALWGLAALPSERRSPETEATVENGLAFLLEAHSLVEADYPTSGRVHTLWSRLNFPLFYQADTLFVLRALAELGKLDHSGAGPALEWLASRRQANGRWRGASPFRRRTWAALADREDTDRWVSLHAAIILRNYTPE